MDIEITEYQDRSYSYIRIRSLNFIGMLDRSADKRFGLAAGKVMSSGKWLVLYLDDGAICWRLDDCSPMGVRFFVDGWGCFTSPDICVFNRDGIVFRAEIPNGFTSIRDVQFFGDKVIFYAERFIFTYDWLGNLIERVRDEARLFLSDLTDMLRWDRLSKAEELIESAKAGNARDAESAVQLLNICSRQFGDNPTAKGKCHRYLGELAFLSGDERMAIEQWRAALKADKKAGIKRQLQALERKAAS